MKAVICTQYGSPEGLKLQDIDQPIPQGHEVLIKIYATTVTTADVRIRTTDPWAVRLVYGLFKPKKTLILGAEMAGEIVAMGEQVTQFKVGDAVFGSTGLNLGAHAEYICLPETSAIALKPAHLTYAEAAAIPFGATTSLIFLRDKGKLQSGQKILIYGASGALGTAAVQLAKAYGAEVTGVCSTANLALVQSLGADQVIDYTQEDFTQRGETYDLVYDTIGKSPFSGCLAVLSKRGTYLRAVHLDPVSMVRGLWTSLTSDQKVMGGIALEGQADLVFLKDLIEAGRFKAVIDRRYPLAQIAEAHRYVEKGHKKGSVVVTVIPEEND